MSQSTRKALAGALGDCVHVAGVTRFLTVAEDEGYETVFTGPATDLESFVDAVSARYAGKPTRIYLIGKDGRVLYNPGIGPFGFSPDELDRVIAAHLAKGS